jgi:hypothetical protein
MWYSYKGDASHILYAIAVEKVNEIIEINSRKKKITQLEDYAEINQGKTEDGNYDISDLNHIND